MDFSVITPYQRLKNLKEIQELLCQDSLNKSNKYFIDSVKHNQKFNNFKICIDDQESFKNDLKSLQLDIEYIDKEEASAQSGFNHANDKKKILENLTNNIKNLKGAFNNNLIKWFKESDYFLFDYFNYPFDKYTKENEEQFIENAKKFLEYFEIIGDKLYLKLFHNSDPYPGKFIMIQYYASIIINEIIDLSEEDKEEEAEKGFNLFRFYLIENAISRCYKDSTNFKETISNKKRNKPIIEKRSSNIYVFRIDPISPLSST